MSQSPATKAPSSVPQLVRDHPALVVSAALVFMSLMHVIAVARFDLATAKALLSVASRTQVLLGTAAYALVIVAVWAVASPDVRRRLKYDEKAPLGRQTITAAASVFGLWLAASVVTPFTVAIFAAAAIFASTMLRRARKAGRLGADGKIIASGEWGPWALKSTFSILIVFLMFILLSSPWVPKEQVTLADQSSTVGYVIGEQSDQTLILTTDRAVVWVATSAIDQRQLCGSEHGRWWTTPIAKLLRDTGYAACPSGEPSVDDDLSPLDQQQPPPAPDRGAARTRAFVVR